MLIAGFHQVQEYLEKDYEILENRFYDGYMVLNPRKCEFMIFGKTSGNVRCLLDRTKKSTNYMRGLVDYVKIITHRFLRTFEQTSDCKHSYKK